MKIFVNISVRKNIKLILFSIYIDMSELKARVGENGKITLPESIMDISNIRPGNEVYFRVENGGIIIESKDPEKIFEGFISSLDKKEEPADIHWDSEYYS